MSPTIARTVQQIPPSGIRRVSDMASRLAAQGKRVYGFHLGTPDFDTPEPIKEAAIAKLRAGAVHYTPTPGIPELRAAIAASVSRRRGVHVVPESVVATVGASEGIAAALMAILEPGDELLVSTPSWLNYLQLPTVLGARVVQAPCSAQDGWVPDPDRLEALVTPRTKALVLNSPNNPTGAVVPRDVLERLVDLAHRHDLWLISDEIYEDLVYDDGTPFTSALAVPGADEVVVMVSGLSKSYSMTGWRLGYVIASPAMVAALLKLHTYLVSGPTSFVQWGGVAALQQEPGREEMRLEYQRRRALVLDGLSAAGLRCVSPSGALYAFPEIPADAANDAAFCERLLAEHGLGLVPGTVFGSGFDRYVRLCFSCATDEVAEGMQVLASALRHSERSLVA